MWSTNNNYGLLNRFQQLYAINPYGFNQVEHPSIDYLPKVWSQYDRELVSGLINKELLAFNKMLGFNIMPMETYEDIPVSGLHNLTDDIQLSAGYINRLGSLTRTSLGTSNVTYTNDLASFSVTLGELEDDEYLEFYFTTSDGATSPTAQGFKIPSVGATYNGTAYLCKCNKWLLVKPSLQSIYDGYISEVVLPNTSNTFVTALSVYKVSYQIPVLTYLDNGYLFDTGLVFDQADIVQPCYLYSYEGLVETITPLNAVVVSNQNGVIRLIEPYSSYTGYPYRLRVYYIGGYPFANKTTTDSFVEVMFENLLLRRVRASLPESYHQQATTTSTRYNKDLELVDNVRLIDMEVQRMVDTYKNMVLGTQFYG